METAETATVSKEGYEPIELVIRGRDTIAAFVCGKCHHVASSTANQSEEFARETARKHCAPYKCEECGSVAERFRIRCDACEERRLQRIEEERFAKAKKITPAEYEGDWVFDPARREGSGGEGFFSDVGELIEHYEDEGLDLPAYVYATNGVTVQIDVDHVLENACEDHHESARDKLNAVNELTKAIEAWNAKQTGATYHPDYSIAILLEPKTETEVEE